MSVMSTSPSTEAAALRHARRLLARHPLIDGHNDLPWTIRNDAKARGDVAAYDLRRPARGHTDLARLKPAASAASSGRSTSPATSPAGGSRASSSSRSTSRGG